MSRISLRPKQIYLSGRLATDYYLHNPDRACCFEKSFLTVSNLDCRSMSLISADNKKAFDLFKGLLTRIPDEVASKISLIVVQHIVPNTSPLIDALAEKFRKIIIIPKPKSVNISLLSQYESQRVTNIEIMQLRREHTGSSKYFIDNIYKKLDNERFIILDIGGYFAESYYEIDRDIGDDKLIGLVEDTENGHQKYLETLEILEDSEKSKPVLSVARSPLKEPEDFLVGKAIVYSVERILRDNNALLINKRVLVLGYGKIGKSIAGSLSSMNVAVWIFDTDPIRRSQALSHGYFTPDRNHAIRHADIIISATGNKSLEFSEDVSVCDFRKLKNGCFLASVTSADDEFSFGGLLKLGTNRENGNGLDTYRYEDMFFHIMNKGNAVNFSHTNTLGPYIYIVACEIIECVVKLLCENPGEPPYLKIQQLTVEERRAVAQRWISAFLEERVV